MKKKLKKPNFQFAIPSEVPVAEGVRIQVIVELMQGDGDWDYGEQFAPYVGRIRINKNLGIRKQRYVYLHELDHAINDIMLIAARDNKHLVKP